MWLFKVIVIVLPPFSLIMNDWPLLLRPWYAVPVAQANVSLHLHYRQHTVKSMCSKCTLLFCFQSFLYKSLRSCEKCLPFWQGTEHVPARISSEELFSEPQLEEMQRPSVSGGKKKMEKSAELEQVCENKLKAGAVLKLQTFSVSFFSGMLAVL